MYSLLGGVSQMSLLQNMHWAAYDLERGSILVKLQLVTLASTLLRYANLRVVSPMS